MPAAVSITTFLSIKTVYKTKTVEIGVPKFLQNFGYKREGGKQFFKFGVGKKRGEPKFFQNLRGEPKPYTLCVL